MFKKLILGIITIGFLSTNSFSMDITSSEGQSAKEDREGNIGIKTSEEMRTSESSRKGYTEALEDSKSKNSTITRQAQNEIFDKLESLEIQDKKDFKSGKTKEMGFFGRCSIISKPKLPADFGITAEDKNGDIDSFIQSYIESAGKANMPISKIISAKKEKDLREYMYCILKYASVGGQSLIDGKFTLNITDDEILRLNERAKNTLKDEDLKCRFSNSTTDIQCNSFKIRLDYEPNLLNSQVVFFSKDSFLGISGTKQYTITTNESVRNEKADSTELSHNVGDSTDKISTKKISDSQDNSVKTDVSGKGFFGSLFK